MTTMSLSMTIEEERRADGMTGIRTWFDFNPSLTLKFFSGSPRTRYCVAWLDSSSFYWPLGCAGAMPRSGGTAWPWGEVALER